GADGATHLVVLARDERLGFYGRLGFRPRRRALTLMSFGTGKILDAGPPRRWLPSPDARDHYEVCAWRPATWTRTPAALRQTAALPVGDAIAWAHFSREGRAALVHRLLAPSPAAAVTAARALLPRITSTTPVLLHGCDAVSSVTASLEDAGFAPVQTWTELHLPLTG
ncbi:MAG: hypothetical protein KC636_36265, partial [Myxococcales bacterium]|nr:hypothetical protein [Myxococcales bacterium]